GFDSASSIGTLVSNEVSKRLMRQGAKLGLAAGILDGLVTAYGAYRKRQAGNNTSAYWSTASALATVISGVAGYGTTMAVAGGGTAFTVLGLSSGPVGWTLLTIAASGVAIWTAVNAAGTDEASRLPVEYWLDNGVFGKRTQLGNTDNNPFATKASAGKRGAPAVPFLNLNDELQALERIISVASGYSMKGAVGNGYFHAHYNVTVPLYSDDSRVTIEFYRNDRDGKKVFRTMSAGKNATLPAVQSG
ncbi:hypothetical protein OY671_008802, partial [Metschnikowia pulcherrima]